MNPLNAVLWDLDSAEYVVVHYQTEFPIIVRFRIILLDWWTISIPNLDVMSQPSNTDACQQCILSWYR